MKTFNIYYFMIESVFFTIHEILIISHKSLIKIIFEGIYMAS